MQQINAFYVSLALYLSLALSINSGIPASTSSTSIAGPNTNTSLVALSSITGKDMAGDKKSKNKPGPRIDISKPDLEMQITAVRDAFKHTRIFSEMPAAELAKLNKSFQLLTQSQSQIDEALAANKAPDESWLREQKTINAILDKSEADSRLICVYEKITGSHRSQRVCRTTAEVARTEERSKDNWQRRGESQLDAPRQINE
jgi:hypothetical protein